MKTIINDDGEAISQYLFAISQENGVYLKSTVEMFQVVASGARELGRSDEQIITFLSTLQKLGTICGSSAQDMENGLRSLSQGLAGGIIRTEEWNSILENTPEIAGRAAKGIEAAGGSIERLHKIMLDGKLTAKDFFEAIEKQTPEIQEEFAKIPVPIDRAMRSLSNSTRNSFRDLNEQLGVTSILNNLLMGLANNMDIGVRALTDASVSHPRWFIWIVVAALSVCAIIGIALTP